PNQRRLIEMLRREDLFTVVVDPFMTDTADLADYVLPAASFLEFDDLVGSYFHISLGAQVKAAEPMGDSLPNSEIFRRLARAMGFDEPELHESDAAIIARQLARIDPKLTFAELAAKGTIPIGDGPAIFHRELRFDTPSGKIEIASERAARDGHPLVPLPLADRRPPGAWLRLLSPADKWLMNSSYGNDPAIRKRLGSTRVVLHSEDAVKRGLQAGMRVELRNGVGAIEMILEISDTVPPGVALTHKTRWLNGSGHSNVNVLNPGLVSDMGASTALHGVQVEVVPAG
ncbi:MAG: molybdopterin dinucleotide binding domain-containing protein, partial [Alphaproteobacteria bacterium]